MDDYISRKEAITWAKHAWNKGYYPHEYLEEVPAADVVEVVHGAWIDYDDDYGSYCCSVCENDAPDDIQWAYCPYCGAKMDKGADNDI